MQVLFSKSQKEWHPRLDAIVANLK
jgi:hypothetical protein